MVICLVCIQQAGVARTGESGWDTDDDVIPNLRWSLWSYGVRWFPGLWINILLPIETMNVKGVLWERKLQ